MVSLGGGVLVTPAGVVKVGVGVIVSVILTTNLADGRKATAILFPARSSNMHDVQEISSSPGDMASKSNDSNVIQLGSDVSHFSITKAITPSPIESFPSHEEHTDSPFFAL